MLLFLAHMIFICNKIDNDNILKMLGQEAQQEVELANLVNGIS